MPPRYAENQDDLQQPFARYRHYRQKYEQSWERHPGIDKSLHHQVQLAPNVS